MKNLYEAYFLGELFKKSRWVVGLLAMRKGDLGDVGDCIF
jgi:hypothetical protein